MCLGKTSPQPKRIMKRGWSWGRDADESRLGRSQILGETLMNPGRSELDGDAGPMTLSLGEAVLEGLFEVIMTGKGVRYCEFIANLR
jgi:hypothetical protein